MVGYFRQATNKRGYCNNELLLQAEHKDAICVISLWKCETVQLLIVCGSPAFLNVPFCIMVLS